jgi:multidrug efflux pump
MTSIAFIAGTIPLILGHGAGAEVRGVTGITVFSGMLGVTLFGLFLTPVFYVTLRKWVTRGKPLRTFRWRRVLHITKNRLHSEGGFLRNREN